MFRFSAEDHQRFTGDRDMTKVRELESFADWLDKHRDELKASQG
ncbi:hypothetical protein [Kribbella jiaozuonensis]|nr:hypothetical protein [Kribbella jiaozuonensis]